MLDGIGLGQSMDGHVDGQSGKLGKSGVFGQTNFGPALGWG